MVCSLPHQLSQQPPKECLVSKILIPSLRSSYSFVELILFDATQPQLKPGTRCLSHTSEVNLKMLTLSPLNYLQQRRFVDEYATASSLISYLSLSSPSKCAEAIGSPKCRLSLDSKIKRLELLASGGR